MCPVVSVIVPVYNGELWIDKCFEGICAQTALNQLSIEVCVCNDASTDNTIILLKKWKNIFQQHAIKLLVYHNTSNASQGVGYSKNKAVSISSAEYLCFQDVDDIMLPNRILFQYNKLQTEPINTIVGSKFKREPDGSTVRYTKWANSLSQQELNVQIYTSHGPTIIMPTWFCHRSVFDKVGGFSEEGKGIPEDLLFFYKHLDFGGRVCRLDECLLIYSYHVSATTFSIHEDTIWKIRLDRVQRDVLSKWLHFTIWNAGKQGRKFYNSLSTENQKKVTAFCDVNIKQIGKTYTPYNAKTRKTGRSIDILHFRKAQPPFVVCVKMDLSNGDFERNLQSLELQENSDYIMFS